MSVLESFFILFKADTTDLKKGQQEADKTTKSLQDKLKSTNTDAQDLAASFVDMAQKAAGFIGVALGVGAAVSSIMDIEKQALSIGFLSENTGYAAGGISALDQQFRRFGGTLQETLGFVKQFREGTTFFNPLGAAGGGAPMMTQMAINARQLGFSVKPNMALEDFLKQVHDRFKTQSPGLNLKEGELLGIPDSWIRALQEGDGEFNKILENSKEIQKYMDANAAAAEEFYKRFGDVNQQLDEIKLSIGTDILNFLNAAYDWFEKNKSALTDWGTAIKIVVEYLGSVLIVTAAISLAFSPIGLSILAVVAAVVILWGVLHYGKEIIAAIGSVFMYVFDGAKKGIEAVTGYLKDMFGWIQKAIDGFEGLWRAKNKPDAAGQAQLDDYSHQQAQLNAARGAISGANSSPFSASPGGFNKSSSSSVTIGKVEVHTQATDADGIASAVGGHLEKYINNATNNFSSSVRA